MSKEELNTKSKDIKLVSWSQVRTATAMNDMINKHEVIFLAIEGGIPLKIERAKLQ